VEKSAEVPGLSPLPQSESTDGPALVSDALPTSVSAGKVEEVKKEAELPAKKPEPAAAGCCVIS